MRTRKQTFSIEISINRHFLARFQITSTPRNADVLATIPTSAIGKEATVVALLMSAQTATDDKDLSKLLADVLENIAEAKPIKWSSDSGILNGNGSAAAIEDVSDIPF